MTRQPEQPNVNRRTFLTGFGAAVVGGVVLAACRGGNAATGATEAVDTSTLSPEDRLRRLDGVAIEVRRDPGCGCCLEWVDYVSGLGAAVTVTEDPQRAAFRRALGIPDSAASCHTGLIDNYAIEGHVPAEAIKKLLADQPDAAGISVPGMPGDSPGMGGDQTTWAAQHVVLIAPDGTATDFTY